MPISLTGKSIFKFSALLFYQADVKDSLFVCSWDIAVLKKALNDPRCVNLNSSLSVTLLGPVKRFSSSVFGAGHSRNALHLKGCSMRKRPRLANLPEAYW